MQSNVVAIRGARLRASFPHPAAREGERSLGLRRLSLIRPPRASDPARRGANATPSPTRALAAELRPRTATIARPRPAGPGSRGRRQLMTWAPRPAPRGARILGAGAPWHG